MTLVALESIKSETGGAGGGANGGGGDESIPDQLSLVIPIDTLTMKLKYTTITSFIHLFICLLTKTYEINTSTAMFTFFVYICNFLLPQ